MKTLLRSCFVGNQNDEQDKELLLRNYFTLYDSGLDFNLSEDVPIWNCIQDFVQAHGHIPELSTLRNHFAARNETQILGRLDVLAVLPAVTGGDFIVRLNNKIEDFQNRATAEALKEAAIILQSGMEVKQGKETIQLRGAQDAIRHVLDKSHDIIAPSPGHRLSGEITHDGADFEREYRTIEADPLAGYGQHCGLDQIDTALNGAKKYELWIHAAFTGGLKSSFMLNWAYNQAVWYRHSSVIFSLEMPYQQCRRLLYAMHSMHGKFDEVRCAMGLQRNQGVPIGLPYTYIRDGTLDEWHPRAKEFLFNYVIPDFNGTKVVEGIDPNTGQPWVDPKYYGQIHIEVANPDKSDFTVQDLRQRAELIYAKTPFKMIFLDHAGLMAPRKWVPTTTERLNEVIRDLKRLAMSFNRGMGIAVVALFQLSRDGYNTAKKRKEKNKQASYDLTSLSYSNEAERSGDVITCTWIDPEMSSENRVQFQCLKSRDQKPFEIFQARIEWPCRRLLTCHDVTMPAAMSQTEMEDIVERVE